MLGIDRRMRPDGASSAGSWRHQLLRLAQVLEHIGADDVVVARSGEVRVERLVLQIGDDDLAAIVRRRQRRRVGIALDAVDDAAILRQARAERAGTAAEIQHARARRDALRDLRQRVGAVRIHLAQIDLFDASAIDEDANRLRALRQEAPFYAHQRGKRRFDRLVQEEAHAELELGHVGGVAAAQTATWRDSHELGGARPRSSNSANARAISSPASGSAGAASAAMSCRRR